MARKNGKGKSRRLGRVVEAIVQDAEMEETATYLSRGRTFAALDAGTLRTRWTAAFKAWFGSRDAADCRLMDDLAAELRLRRLDLPLRTVEAEFVVMRAELREAGPGDPALTERIRQYLEASARPN
jgi:hypothetical protein